MPGGAGGGCGCDCAGSPPYPQATSALWRAWWYASSHCRAASRCGCVFLSNSQPLYGWFSWHRMQCPWAMRFMHSPLSRTGVMPARFLR